MLLTRRHFLAAAAATGLAPGSSFAASYPEQELVWLIYQSPGGTIDVSTRIVQPYLEKAGFKVRLEYATGAAGRIARNKLFAAKPDGYTLMTDVHAGGARELRRDRFIDLQMLVDGRHARRPGAADAALPLRIVFDA